MIKVNVIVTDKYHEDVTDLSEITAYNQETGRTITKRSDGYYYCNVGVLYTFDVRVNDAPKIYTRSFYGMDIDGRTATLWVEVDE